MLFGRKKQKLPALYTDAERAALEAHISKHFGAITAVIRDRDSVDISVDIAVISPTYERNFFTLVTMGLGAYCMNVPKKKKKYAYEFERTELMICLPPDWDMKDVLTRTAPDKKWYWPVKLLKDTAHLPIRDNILLDLSLHSAERPYADGVKFCGVLLSEIDEIFDGILNASSMENMKVYRLLCLGIRY